MKNVFIVILTLISLNSFAQDENSTKSNIMTVGCKVIKKEFIRKNGEPAGFDEIYLRCPGQDYFVKFCESRVNSITLEEYVDKSITVEIEIREGNWDICQGDLNGMQSRVGTYAIVNKIISTEQQKKKKKEKKKKTKK